MPVAIDATPGGPAANSYATEAEATAYFAARAPLATTWTDVTDKTALLAMATRLLDQLATAHKVLRLDKRGGPKGYPYYVTTRRWTGAVATDDQALAWPRTGMRDRLGRVVPANVVPHELKEAQLELAGHLAQSDITLDNEAEVQGIASVRAGSVEVRFRELFESRTLPGGVMALLPSSWLTDEVVTPAVRSSLRAL